MHQNMGEMLLFYSDCAVWTIDIVPRLFFWLDALQSGDALSTGQIGLALCWEILVHCREVVCQVTGYLGMHCTGRILVHALFTKSSSTPSYTGYVVMLCNADARH